MSKIVAYLKKYYVHLVFFITLAGLFGSLYMSEVEQMAPCPFCWWARVWMYPLVFITAIAIITKDKLVKYYIATLSLLGTAFCVYHNLLQRGVFAESESCTVGGTTCAVPTIALEIGSLQFSLEFLSLLAFIMIDVIVLAVIFLERKTVANSTVNESKE